MATVQLSNIIDTTVFRDLPAVDGPEKTAFWESGVIARSPLFDMIADAPGKGYELPFWNDLDASVEPNYSNDDPTDIAVPQNLAQADQAGWKAFLNEGWSAADLAAELVMGQKPMERIRQRIDTYWRRQFQRRLLASARGVLADNIANDGADMAYVAAGATNADVTASTVFTRENFTTAAYTMGDMVDEIQLIAVHSVVMKRMVDNGDVETIRDEDGQIILQSYLGKRIVVDDSMPYVPASGTGGADDAPRYTSILFGRNAFGYGEGTPMVPYEVERQAAQGQGGGVETLWSRKTWLLHPFGFKQVVAPSTEESHTLAQLASAATWDRVVARKNVPLAFLVTNG